jgi:hypothetical protein
MPSRRRYLEVLTRSTHGSLGLVASSATLVVLESASLVSESILRIWCGVVPYLGLLNFALLENLDDAFVIVGSPELIL